MFVWFYRFDCLQMRVLWSQTKQAQSVKQCHHGSVYFVYLPQIAKANLTWVRTRQNAIIIAINGCFLNLKRVWSQNSIQIHRIIAICNNFSLPRSSSGNPKLCHHVSLISPQQKIQITPIWLKSCSWTYSTLILRSKKRQKIDEKKQKIGKTQKWMKKWIKC